MSDPWAAAKRRETAVAETVTGFWYCAHGGHRTKGEATIHNGRRVCQRCMEQVRAAQAAKKREVR